MAVLIPKGTRNAIRAATGPMVLGVELHDAREELFVVMVCDGLPLGLAFKRAGFESKNTNAPYNLFHLPRVQERANAILEARRSTGVVSLGEVTDMLRRVFAGAQSAEEYSAAHNAAFSLARLFGHVTDKATLEVIRRPSRDPDAPSEQALGDWVAGLPVINGPGPGFENVSQNSALSGPPAAPLGGPGPFVSRETVGPGPFVSRETVGPEPSMHVDVLRNQPEFPNDINGLEEFRTLTCIGTGPAAPGRPENGAPADAVTVTHHPRAHSELLGPGPPEKGAPGKEDEGTRYPKMEDLF